MSEIFISYKRQEREKARAIAEMLVKHGYDVWWDIDLLPGDKFSREIDQVIKSASAAIVLWSKRAVESNFIRAEAHKANNRNLLIPVRLDECELPIPFNINHTTDLSAWDGSSDSPLLEPLVKAVKKKIGGRSGKVQSPVEIKDKIEHPRALSEIEYWKSISASNSSSINEYQAYINKYTEKGIFYELAKVKIEALEESSKRKPRSNKTLKIAISAVAISILLIVSILFFLPIKDDPIAGSRCAGNTRIDGLRDNLFESIKQSDLASVKDCVGKLNTINFRNQQHGHTPLASAAFHGNLEITKLLVSRGANVNLTVGDKGLRRTPLHFAIKNGNKEVARFLICKNAAKNVRDSKGKTPLDYGLSDSYRTIRCR